MVRALVVPADAELPIEPRDFATLEDYQAAVGGWIEAVDLSALGITMYVNEEGLLQQLPFNSRASCLWWCHVPEARQKALLVGDVVLVGLPDRNGDSTDLPMAAHELLLTPATCRVEVRGFGDPTWHRNRATYPDYWEAILGAMAFQSRNAHAEQVRVVPVESDSVGGSATN